MSSFASACLAQVVQVAIVFALVALLDALIARRVGATLRAALWGAFFVKLIVPPGATSPVSIARFADGARTSTADVAPADGSSGLALAALLAWGLVCAVFLAVGLARMRRADAKWLRSARPADPSSERTLAKLAARLAMRRAPRLLVHDEHDGAASVGIVAPVIVVSSALVRSETALEHVLLHELGHVRRHDALRAAAWTLARCAYWFHPLVHAAARRAALVRELACDEFAARHARGGTLGYRRTLLELARPLAAAMPCPTGFGGAAMITARLERLERARNTARRFDVLPGFAFVVLCACCVPLGANGLAASALPAFDEVEGCMPKRLLVMAELAKENRAEPRTSPD